MITTLLVDFAYVLYQPKSGVWQLNKELWKALIKYKNQGLKVAVFSASDMVNDAAIQAELSGVVSEFYSSKTLGVSKTDPNAYRLVCTKMGKQTSEVLFIDDSLINVEAAREAGMPIIYYHDPAETERQISSLLTTAK